MKTKSAMLVSLFAVAGSLHAGVIAYTNSTAMNSGEEATFNLTKFDSNLGTLTGVYLEYAVQLSGANVQLDNDSALPQSGTAAVLNTVSNLTTSVGTTGTGINRFALYIDASKIFNLAATTNDVIGEFNATEAGDYATWSPGILTVSSGGDVSDTDWADYIGTGQFSSTILDSFYTSASFNGSDGYFQGNTPNGLFTGTVTYTYAIPEPASAALIAVVLVGAAWIRRRFID